MKPTNPLIKVIPSLHVATKESLRKLTEKTLNKIILEKAFATMATAKAMTELYEENFKTVSKYVHATSRGHEAIQLATAFQLLPCDFVSPYYRDESMLLGLGFSPYELMLQLLAKGNDGFTGFGPGNQEAV